MSDIYQQTAALIREEVNRQIDARYQNWITGKRTGTNTYQLRETGYPNRVYVRPSNESYEARLVWGNAAYVNIPVIIRRLQDGEWQIDDVDFVASGAIGEKVAGMLQPPVAGDGTKLVLPGYNFRPGRPRIDASGRLTAYIEPFNYWRDRLEYYYPGGTVDLTSAVPGTTGTWRWVKIGVTPVTNAIVTATGTAQSVYEPLTPDALAAITMDDDIVLGGVKLRNGQTSLGIVDGDFADARQHFWTPHPLLAKSNLSASTNPGTGDDSADGYAVGSLWINTTAGVVHQCVDATAGAAEWAELGSTTPVTTVTSVGTKWDAFAPPSSPSATDDEFSDNSVSGWTELDFATNLTPSEDSAGLLLTLVGSSGHQNAGLVKAIPAGDFTIETHCSIGRGVSSQMHAGLFLCEDTTSSGDMIAFTTDPHNARIGLLSWAAYNSYSGDIALQSSYPEPGAWFRITRSSTTYTYYWSTDGLTWRYHHSHTPSFTPGYFGVNVYSNSSSSAYGRFSFFRYTNSALNAGQHIGGQRVNMVTVS